MTILFLCNSSYYGGAEIWVERAALALRERGHGVVLAAPAAAALSEAMAASGVPCIALDAGPVLNKRSAAAFVLGWRRNRRRMLHAIEAARGRYDVDVVHLGLTSEKLLVGSASPVPVAWTEHGPLPTGLVRSPLFVVYRRAGLAAPGIHCVSEATTSHFREIGFPPDHLRTIRTGLRFDEGSVERAAELRATFGFEEDHVVVGFVGRLVGVKGLDSLLAAVRRLAPSHPELRFLVVGGGRLRPELEADVVRFGLKGRVVFTGHRPDVPDLLQLMDLYVAPSRMEGLPMAVLEAMQAGLPAVATDVGGHPELIEDGETGFLTPVGSVDALAARLAKLASDPALRVSLGAAARRRAEEEFGHATFVDRLEVFMADAASAPAPGARA